MLPPDNHDIHARLSVVEVTIRRMDSTLEAVASDVKDMKQYQDRQRGAFAVLIVGAGAVGAAITKVVTYLATKVGIA